MTATPPIALCKEKSRLMRKHEESIDKYYSTVEKELERKLLTAIKPGFQHLSEEVMEAVGFVKLSRRELLQHIADHGCVGPLKIKRTQELH
jgi:hypothetical protein